MLKLLKLFVALAAAALVLLLTPVANAQAPTRSVVPLSAECTDAVESGATGYAYLSINEENGRITYSVAAFNLPGTLTAAHIHGPINPATGNGPVAAHLELTGLNSGFVATKSTTDPALAAAILANPANFYFNLHTTTCPGGALRGSLG
jgi:CHRD domain